jgi:hypothetical protein
VVSHDFGPVDYGRTYSISFPVRNGGDFPLHLTITRKSCTCGEVAINPELLPPGQNGDLSMRWTPQPGQVGPVNLSAEVSTSDPQRPKLRMEILGQVEPLVALWPEDWFDIDFKQLQPGQPAQREVTVYSARLDRFGLAARTSHPGLVVSTKPLPADAAVGDRRARCGYVVSVRTTDALPRGYFRETLTLDVNSGPTRQITLPIYGQVETGAVHVVPTEIEFKTPRLADGESQRVQVRFLVPSAEDKVTVARCEPTFLTADAPQAIRKGLWQFSVRIPANDVAAVKLQPDRFFEGRIVLRTSAAAAPEVPVRVKWNPPDP